MPLLAALCFSAFCFLSSFRSRVSSILICLICASLALLLRSLSSGEGRPRVAAELRVAKFWPLTQYNYNLLFSRFSPSRIGVWKSEFSVNLQSRFVSLIFDGVLEPLRLAAKLLTVSLHPFSTQSNGMMWGWRALCQLKALQAYFSSRRNAK